MSDPAPVPDSPPRASAPSTQAGGSAFTRTLRTRSGWIFGLWAVISAAAIGLVLVGLSPTYEAQAWLKVEPTGDRAFMEPPGRDADLDGFLEAQALLLTSPEVLQAALRVPEVARSPRVQNSTDPVARLREDLSVSIPPGTPLLTISLTGTQPAEVAAVVNAVTDAYLSTARQAEARAPAQVKLIAQATPAGLPRYDLRPLVWVTGSAGALLVLVILFTRKEAIGGRPVGGHAIA